MLSTDKQTDKLTNATKNITSFAKEVINNGMEEVLGGLEVKLGERYFGGDHSQQVSFKKSEIPFVFLQGQKNISRQMKANL